MDLSKTKLSDKEIDFLKEHMDGEKMTDDMVEKLAISRSQNIALFIA